jgi:fluoride ion exporter CrcB/FEX
MGFATEAFEEIFSTPNHHLNVFIATGFLGGFTTFSSFALEFG